MGQVLWHVTMSLDGFIAGPGDDMSWLADHLGPNPTAEEVLAQIGALLIGDRTYQLAKTEEGRPYGGAWTGPQFVLSHHPPKDPPAGFTFLSGDIEEAVATAKAAAGDKYVVVLGADTARSCLNAGCSTRSWSHRPRPAWRRGSVTRASGRHQHQARTDQPDGSPPGDEPLVPRRES